VGVGVGVTLYVHGGGFEHRNPEFEQVMAYQDMVHAFHLSALPEAPPQVAITFLDRLTAWTAALRHLG
jgi:hypothetical protein